MSGISEVDYPQLLEGYDTDRLREHFQERPEELPGLFEMYVSQEEWTKEHPELSLKAFILLDPETQKSEIYQKILRVIVATGVFSQGEHIYLIQEILADQIQSNHWEFIYRLIELGISPNTEVNDGNTFLHYACKFSMREAAIKLIELKADVNPVNLSGETPLILACQNELVDVSRVLVEQGADPFVRDLEDLSPVFYACRAENEELLNILQPKEYTSNWDVELASSYAALESDEKADEIIERYSEGIAAKVFIRKALKFPCLSAYMMEKFRELMDSQIECIRRKSQKLELKEKLVVLALLLPEYIREVLEEVPEFVIQRWMSAIVVIEEEEDLQTVGTIHEALVEANLQWAEYIDWEDNDLEGVSGMLIANLSSFLRRVPLKALSAAAMDEQYSVVMRNFLRAMSFDELAVVVPHFEVDEFEEIITALPFEMQISVLHVATQEQKLVFLEAAPLPCNPLIQEWYAETFESCCLLMEEMGKCEDDQELDRITLVEFFRDYRLRLPHDLKTEFWKLKKLKKALLNNHRVGDVASFVKKEIDPRIQNHQKSLDVVKKVEDTEKYMRTHSLGQELGQDKRDPPEPFVCILTGDVMKEPVTAHEHTFEREAIATWLETNSTCPICRDPVKIDDFSPNNDLLDKIVAWREHQ